MEWVPVVQAVTIANVGPFRPSMIESWPEIMLMIEPGTKNGDIRRGPRFVYSAWFSSISGRPPMPEPTIAPMRSAFASLISSPLSRTAWMLAAIPKWMKVSKCRASFAGMYWAMSKPLTSPAICAGNADASKRVIRSMPERPATRFSQAEERSLPTGLTMPRPVMTTRRRLKMLSSGRPSGISPCCAR